MNAAFALPPAPAVPPDRAIVADAVALAAPLLGSRAWVIVAGSRDRGIAALVPGARVVMYDAADALSLPREAFDLALFVRGAGEPVTLAWLVPLRNSLRKEACLVAVLPVPAMHMAAEIAETAGFSRRRALPLSHSFGVLELRR